MDYLIVDMTRVLRESEHGKAARASLEKLIERTKEQEALLRDKYESATGASAKREAKTKHAEFTEQRAKEIGRRRDALESALVRLVNAAVRAEAEARGVELVLERGAAVFFPPEADCTDAVLARVDAVQLGN